MSDLKRRIEALERAAQPPDDQRVRVYYEADVSAGDDDPNTLRREPDGSYTDLETGQPVTGRVFVVTYDDSRVNPDDLTDDDPPCG